MDLPEDAQSGRVVLSMDFIDNDTNGNNFAFTIDGGGGNFQLRRSGKVSIFLLLARVWSLNLVL